MRNLEEIEKELSEAREELARAKGAPAEVYSRIVGYYRSVRNWNKGKREEYGERKLYDVDGSLEGAPARFTPEEAARTEGAVTEAAAQRLILFTRPACPACPAAKKAAAQLSVPVEVINADTDEGLAEATRYNVMSTPTAILLTKDGKELDRARDSVAIAKLNRYIMSKAA
ncbi:MAG: thiol reductase thioredoxin [Spirochaetaceae bacterium]|jgi:ribonucleoside-triphosphate reductase|nr:thiol reductase thioredoxin [Spirochaetaceae bacterium]